MDTLKSGDVIIADFPGVTGVKRRPWALIIFRLEIGKGMYPHSNCCINAHGFNTL